MPPLLYYRGEDELFSGTFSGTSFHPNSLANNMDSTNKPRNNNNRIRKLDINALPDECLFEIFRFLSGQERGNCACVSKHWLKILSTIRLSEMHQNANEDLTADGFLTRCLEGRKATDTRLAAIAIGTAPRGGLGKLSIRGSNVTRGVTNSGLSAISRGCPALRCLSIWDVSTIGDEGLAEISKECHVLDKLDLCTCPWITDAGLAAISKGCPDLETFSVEACASIGDDGIRSIAQGCTKLRYISIRDCPLVGDIGVASLSSPDSVLTKVRLEDLNISDASLSSIGEYGKSVLSIGLVNLRNVTEDGFRAMGNGKGLEGLLSLTIGSCSGVTDSSLEAIGKGCPTLKHLSLYRCSVSDAGLTAFSKSAESLDAIHLEVCHSITLLGVISTLSNSNSNLKSFSFVKCMGLKDHPIEIPTPTHTQNPCTTLICLSIKNCPNFGTPCLRALANMCPNLIRLDLMGLDRVTDTGLLALLQTVSPGLAKLNLTGCVNLTDRSLLSILRLHGETIELLNLSGCRKITNATLYAISSYCPVLVDLDLSKCDISDSGMAAMGTSLRLKLLVLSISGCNRVSNRSLPYLLNLGKTLTGLNIKYCNAISLDTLDVLIGSLTWCDILS